MIGMNRFVTDIAPKADRRRGPLGIEAAKLKFWPKSVHQILLCAVQATTRFGTNFLLPSWQARHPRARFW
jgi:hypothetical protein